MPAQKLVSRSRLVKFSDANANQQILERQLVRLSAPAINKAPSVAVFAALLGLVVTLQSAERWTQDTGPEGCVRKVKAAPLPRQMCTTFCCCWPCGVVGDAPASSKCSGKSTGLTPAAHVIAGVL